MVTTTAPSPTEILAEQHYQDQLALSGALAFQVEQVWSTIPDPFRLWSWYHRSADSLSDMTTEAQLASISETLRYMGQVITSSPNHDDEIVDVNPFAILSNTEMIQDRLGGVARWYGDAVSKGAPQAMAQRASQVMAQEIVTGLARDAGREAASVMVSADEGITGYVRKLNLPSCGLCAVLSGKFFKHNQGFQVHDHCDCVHVPVFNGDNHRDVIEANGILSPEDAILTGKVHGVSKNDYEAIKAGADAIEVMNSKIRRGMNSIEIQGKKVRPTMHGITKRGWWGAERGYSERRFEIPTQNGSYRVPYDFRLTASDCIRLSNGDQAVAIDLLRKNGYIWR